MEIDIIKFQIAEKLSNDYDTWNNVLYNTQSENYVCSHWEAEINPADVRVDIPNRTFLVSDGFFSSNVTLGSSDNGLNEFYNKAFAAKGKFEFETAENVKIKEIEIDIEIDIF
ncbi:hypothetical protein DRF60_13050 [Chryseobacterium elymi]|uniref:Uncharacterized protein n=1 Tax=Chryseobacterium elymi TaxID=395936 RepID=A0A3D9DFL6_9FLAO|nr:hypothetical protein [Chryseobacterium elymi]REC76812.1 hypothetical protein DRF60_13050 [Chryseobacterium elymi]